MSTNAPRTRRTCLRDHVWEVVRTARTPQIIPEIADTVGCAVVTVRRHLKSLRDAALVVKAGTLPRSALTQGRRSGRAFDLYQAATHLKRPEH